MASYKINYAKSFLSDLLENFSKQEAKIIRNAVMKLAQKPHPANSKLIHKAKQYYRLKLKEPNARIIYHANDRAKKVLVLYARWRGPETYKNI